MTTSILKKIDTLFDRNAETNFNEIIDCKTLGQRLAAVYESPEMAQPPICKAAELFLKNIADCPAQMHRAILDMAEAAEHSGVANGYHNPAHTFKVMTNAMVLAQINQRQAVENNQKNQFLSDEDMATLLIAAIAHDLDHDGKTNRDAQNTRIPFRLETMAVNHAKAIMQHDHVGETLQDDVAAIIYTTDIGEPAGLKFIAKRQEEGAISETDLPAQLQRLAKDKRLVGLAQILCDADLLGSAGLTMASLNKENASLAIEWNKRLGPDHSIGFLNNVVGGSFKSSAGKFFNPNLNMLRHNAEQTLAAGTALTRPIQAPLHTAGLK